MIDSKNKKDIKVRAHLSRWSGGNDLFGLVITDATSGLVILEVNFDVESFADLMSNRSTSKTSNATYYGSPNIGKKHECKNYQVSFKHLKGVFESYDLRERDMEIIQDRAEIDNPGWKVDKEEYNSKRNKNGEYTVTLRRYVKE